MHWMHRMSWKILLVVLLLLTMPASLGRAQASTDPDEDFRQAIEFFEARQFLESRRILERLTETHPTRALYWFNLANSDYMLEDYANALQGYQKVIALRSPLSPPARLYAARAHRKTGEHTSAVRELNMLQGTRLPPEMTAALHSEIDALQAVLLEVGIDLYRSQRYREALQKFRPRPGNGCGCGNRADEGPRASSPRRARQGKEGLRFRPRRDSPIGREHQAPRRFTAFPPADREGGLADSPPLLAVSGYRRRIRLQPLRQRRT